MGTPYAQNENQVYENLPRSRGGSGEIIGSMGKRINSHGMSAVDATVIPSGSVIALNKVGGTINNGKFSRPIYKLSSQHAMYMEQPHPK